MQHPLKTAAEQIDFCAFCQNPCRTAAGHDVVPESHTPSAMSLIARAVLKGHIEPSEDVLAHLTELDGVRLCQRDCLYGYDMAGGIEGTMAPLKERATA